MKCDDEIGQRTAGADWVTWWTVNEDLSDDTIDDWEDLIVEVKDGARELLATSQGDSPTVITTGAFVGEPGEVPATNFGAGIIAWVILAAVTAAFPMVVTVQAWTRRGGPDEPFYTETIRVVPPIAVREQEVGS